MKRVLFLMSFLPFCVSAQMSFDSFNNVYQYRESCEVSHIVQGTPTKVKHQFKAKEVSLIQIAIDTVFYGPDSLIEQYSNTVYVLLHNEVDLKSTLTSSLFVLRRLLYCESMETKCRPILYCELVLSFQNPTQSLKIIERSNKTLPCKRGQSCLPIKNNGKIYPLDDIEKVIYKLNKRK